MIGYCLFIRVLLLDTLCVPMLVSSYLLVRMEGRIERLSANIESLTHVLQDRLVMQFPYVQQQ